MKPCRALCRSGSRHLDPPERSHRPHHRRCHPRLSDRPTPQPHGSDHWRWSQCGRSDQDRCRHHFLPGYRPRERSLRAPPRVEASQAHTRPDCSVHRHQGLHPDPRSLDRAAQPRCNEAPASLLDYALRRRLRGCHDNPPRPSSSLHCYSQAKNRGRSIATTYQSHLPDSAKEHRLESFKVSIYVERIDDAILPT